MDCGWPAGVVQMNSVVVCDTTAHCAVAAQRKQTLQSKSATSVAFVEARTGRGENGERGAVAEEIAFDCDRLAACCRSIRRRD